MTFMAKQLSREQFLRNLSDSGLFSRVEMDAALDALPGPQEEDGEAVAQRLIAAGKLTNQTSGESFELQPLGEVGPIIEAGGVFPYAKKVGMLKG